MYVDVCIFERIMFMQGTWLLKKLKIWKSSCLIIHIKQYIDWNLLRNVLFGKAIYMGAWMIVNNDVVHTRQTMTCIMSLSFRCWDHKKECEDLFCMHANCVVTMQFIIILYFQKVLESPQMRHLKKTIINNLMRRLISCKHFKMFSHCEWKPIGEWHWSISPGFTNKI